MILRSGGRALSLSTPEKWRRAIALGDLTPDTQIEIVRDGEPAEPRRAGDLPQLAPYFAALEERLEPAPPREPAPVASVPASGPEAEPPPSGPAPSAVPASAASSPAPSPVPVAPVSPAKAARRPGCGCLLAVIAAVIVIIVIAISLAGGDKAASGQTVQVYVVRLTRVRAQPTADGKDFLTTLSRGEALTGRWVTGGDGQTKWLKLSEGIYKDDYVWGANLSASAPPPLARIVGKTRAFRRAHTLRVQPQADSAAAQDVAAGARVMVTGRTANGWWEIGLASGGVAYASPDSF